MGQTAEELRQQLDEQRDMVGRDLVAIGDRVSPGRMVERRRMAIRQSFGRARNAVMGAADTATTASGERIGGVGSAVAGAPDAVLAQTQGNPFAAGIVAFGAGALIGSLLPKTRYEAQAAQQVQPALETAASELGAEAKDLAENVKEHAVEAADRLKESAQDAAETVKADASDAAAETKAEAQAAAKSAQPT